MRRGAFLLTCAQRHGRMTAGLLFCRTAAATFAPRLGMDGADYITWIDDMRDV